MKVMGRLARNHRFAVAQGPAAMSSAAPAVGITLQIPGIGLSTVQHTPPTMISASPTSEAACALSRRGGRLDESSAAGLRGVLSCHAASIPPAANSQALVAGL